MRPSKPEEVFTDSFNTFKAFKNISLANLKSHLDYPATLWQILNHLIMWQEWQLATLREKESLTSFDESKTWLTDKYPVSQEELNQAVDTFYGQVKAVQEEIRRLGNQSEYLISEWKLIQEMSLHLSFHLGEIVLMRRLSKDYPLPHQMKEFLAQE